MMDGLFYSSAFSPIHLNEIHLEHTHKASLLLEHQWDKATRTSELQFTCGTDRATSFPENPIKTCMAHTTKVINGL